jgi:hypothetical protein
MLAKDLIPVELICWQKRTRLVSESGGKGGNSFKGSEVKRWNMGCGDYLNGRYAKTCIPQLVSLPGQVVEVECGCIGVNM